MKTKVPIIFLMIAVLTSCVSSYDVIKVDENTEAPKAQGVYYSLPRNVVTIDITVIKTKKIAGPYARYASKYLGIKNAAQINSVSYEMTDIKINTYAEPDPEQFYFVNLSKYKPSKARSMLLSLSEAGLIQDVNDNSDAMVMQEKKEELAKTKIDYSETFKYFADANLKERVDTIIEKVNIDTITIEKRILRRRMVEKTLEEKAKEAADFIMKVKEQRFDILTGAQEVAYSQATIRLMNEELEKMEKEYMMLFTGITERETFQYRYTYIPEPQIYNASIPLFKFSKVAGVVDENFRGGKMVYIHVNRARSTMGLSTFAKANVDEDAKASGFYYRTPEYAKFSVVEGTEQIAEASFLISQFGVVVSLPPGDVKLQFYPNTGGLRKVEIK
jgi:hypothetical protein